MLSSHDLPSPPLDKFHSDRGLDHQPAIKDVTESDDCVVVRTPSHSLPAVGFSSLQTESSPAQLPPSSSHSAHGNVGKEHAKHSGDGTQLEIQVSGDGGLDGMGGFLDVDDDVALHVDRDPNHWHDMVRIKFDDLFGEPDPEVYSKDNIWALTNKVFTSSKYWCYRVVSMVLAVPLAAMWGVFFACTVFCRVWCCVPCLKACDIQMHCVRRLNETLLRTFVAPCYEAVGRCFYHVRIRLVKATEDSQ